MPCVVALWTPFWTKLIGGQKGDITAARRSSLGLGEYSGRALQKPLDVAVALSMPKAGQQGIVIYLYYITFMLYQ